MPGTDDALGHSEGPPPTLASLVAENALLKRKLSIPTEQRVVQEVMSREVNSLLREAMQKVTQSENQIGAAPRFSDDDNGAVRQTLAEVLSSLSAEKEAVGKHLSDILSNTVAPLQEQVVQLERERAALRSRVGELELTISSQSPPAVVAELEALRKSEALYCSQLAAAEGNEEAAAAKVKAILAEGVAAARSLPEYAEVIEGLKEALRGSRAARDLLAVELEEQASRTALLRELEKKAAQESQDRLEERAQLLESQLRDSAAREEALSREKQDLEEQVRRLREENTQLSAQTNSTEDAARAKRQRIEEESTSGGHSPSVRLEFIRFWYEGRDTIGALERKVASLEKTATDLRVAQGRVAQLERSRETTLEQLTSVAQEVNRMREENQKQRAQIVGLEVERDQLLSAVATTVGEHMSAMELEACCRTIREAARNRAAASAAVVTDPEALRQAIRKAQELKNEVAVLQKQKDKLTHYVRIQEDRVVALTEQNALLTLGRPRKLGSKSMGTTPAGPAAPAASSPTSSSSTWASMTLPQFLESVLSGAKDVLWESEIAAIGILDDRTALDEAMSRHRDSFVALQSRLLESQGKLLGSQRKLQEVLRDNVTCEARAEQVQKELTSMIEAKDAALHSLEETNAALLQHTAAVTGQKRELRRQLDAMTVFAEHMLRVLGEVFGLFQKEVAHVKDLRRLVAQERSEMMELVRQSSTGGSLDVAAVTDGLRYLADFIQTTVDENKLRGEVERADFLKKLVGVLKQQEDRVSMMQKDFMNASQTQAMSIAQRVAAAQKEWESAWKTRCEAAEAQRDQLSAIGVSSQALHHALEGATVHLSEGGKSASQSPTDAVNPTLQKGDSSLAASTRDTLTAIDDFIERARQQLANRKIAAAAPPAPPPAPAPLTESSAVSPQDVSEANPLPQLADGEEEAQGAPEAVEHDEALSPSEAANEEELNEEPAEAEPQQSP